MTAFKLIQEDMNGGGVIQTCVDLGEAGLSVSLFLKDIKNDEQTVEQAVEAFEENFNSLIDEKVSISIEDTIDDEIFLIIS